MSERLMILSSDGHAVGKMEGYREYLESRYHEDFDDFLLLWNQHGASAVEEKATRMRVDDDVAVDWTRDFLSTGRTDGYWDSAHRIVEMDRNGFAGEVLFPDFGTPFSLGSPTVAAVLGIPSPTHELMNAGFRAHNRWVSDFVSVAPHRFAPMASMTFGDIDAAVREIKWAHESGFRGIVLPPVPDEAQLYDDRYSPIWRTLEDLGMVLNCHVSLSGELPPYNASPHPTTTVAIMSMDVFAVSQRNLRILIWGGVLERHPSLKVVFTELHSDWVRPLLARMDFAYGRGDLRNDIKSLVPRKPSEYWERQCFLGSSIFSKAEIAARDTIGVSKMMLGFDYPHFEGAWRIGTNEYLRETLGFGNVSAQEARVMLGTTAADVFGFDSKKLEPLVEQIGPTAADVLTAPTTELEVTSADLYRPLQMIG